MSNQTTFRGVVHGNTVVLAGETGLPDGQQVTVSLQPYVDPELARQGLAKSFGAWKDEGPELDAYLKWSRQDRNRDRRENPE